MLAIAILQIRSSVHKRNIQYQEFLEESPGIDRGKALKTYEHAFKEPFGLSKFVRGVSFVQNAVLSLLGIEVRPR